MCHLCPHSCTNTNTKSFILSRSYINNNVSSNELFTDIMLIFGKLSPLGVKLLFFNTQVGIHMYLSEVKESTTLDLIYTSITFNSLFMVAILTYYITARQNGEHENLRSTVKHTLPTPESVLKT